MIGLTRNIYYRVKGDNKIFNIKFFICVVKNLFAVPRKVEKIYKR